MRDAIAIAGRKKSTTGGGGGVVRGLSVGTCVSRVVLVVLGPASSPFCASVLRVSCEIGRRRRVLGTPSLGCVV
eukprot:13724122-Heterocapsa_arctica.AAC.1